MNVEKIISQLESKETLLIFLRDNFPDALEKWKNKNAVVTSHSSRTSSETGNSGGDPKSHQF